MPSDFGVVTMVTTFQFAAHDALARTDMQRPLSNGKRWIIPLRVICSGSTSAWVFSWRSLSQQRGHCWRDSTATHAWHELPLA